MFERNRRKNGSEESGQGQAPGHRVVGRPGAGPRLAAIAGTAALLLAACGTGDPSIGTDVLALEDGVGADSTYTRLDTRGVETVEATLTFQARVGVEPFACGRTYPGVGTSATQLDPLDLRMYIHDIRLLADTASGPVEVPAALVQDGVWQYQDVVLLDFEDKSGACSNGTLQTNGSARILVPPGTYTGVRFRLGVPEALNHVDLATAPSPLNLSGLYWNWTGGYKFLRADAKSAGLASFNIHLGATGCDAPDPQSPVTCTRRNVADADLRGFDPLTEPIVVDYGALVQDSDLDANTADTPMGCMSDPADPDCAGIFANLGLNVETGAGDATRQTFFRRK